MPTTDAPMAREELKSHLTTNEGVSQKLDKHLEVLAAAKEYSKWSCRLSAATLTVFIIVVGLMGLLMG